MCQKYLLILPPPLFKRFYPLRKDLKGIPYLEMISSQLPTARIWWEQQPAVFWELTPSRVPTAFQGSPFGWLIGRHAIPYSQQRGSWSLCTNSEHHQNPLLFP